MFCSPGQVQSPLKIHPFSVRRFLRGGLVNYIICLSLDLVLYCIYFSTLIWFSPNLFIYGSIDYMLGYFIAMCLLKAFQMFLLDPEITLHGRMFWRDSAALSHLST